VAIILSRIVIARSLRDAATTWIATACGLAMAKAANDEPEAEPML
jgi:hypothetical protein